MASVELWGLVKSFGGRRVVDAIDLTIQEGELLVLVGPSGCGKTTTLRMIAGLETPDSGEIRIGNRVVNRIGPRDRDVAMVFQNYALYPHMTVRKNLGFGLQMRRVPRAEIAQRVAAVAEMLEITEWLDRKPNQLSGGQRQRVALGRAVVRQPAVFLLDEPLSNLDAKLRATMRTELVRLHRQVGTTMIHVTHDQTEAMMMGDRIVVMNQGRIEQAGRPMEVYKKPATRFVAEFVGSSPMNFLAGSLAGQQLTIAEATVQWKSERNSAESAETTIPQPNLAKTSRDVTVGLRPEDITVQPAGFAAPTGDVSLLRLPAEIDLVQPMGAVTLLHCRWKEHSLTAAVHSATLPTVGESITLLSQARHLHLFDASTGQRI